MQKFEEESKEQGVVYALVPQVIKEAGDKTVSSPPEIKSLLHDFRSSKRANAYEGHSTCY